MMRREMEIRIDRVQDEGTSGDSGVRRTEGRDKVIRGGFEGGLLGVHPG